MILVKAVGLRSGFEPRRESSIPGHQRMHPTVATRLTPVIESSSFTAFARGRIRRTESTVSSCRHRNSWWHWRAYTDTVSYLKSLNSINEAIKQVRTFRPLLRLPLLLLLLLLLLTAPVFLPN